jgi:hypothetical protein
MAAGDEAARGHLWATRCRRSLWRPSFEVVWLWLALSKASPLDRHDFTFIIAGNAVRRSDPITITRDSDLEAASVAAATA